VDKSIDYKKQLEKLTEIGIALSTEFKLEKLLESIVFHARDITNADGGTLYLLQDDELHFKIIQNTSLNIFLGGDHNDKITLAPIKLLKTNVAGYSAILGKTVNIDDVYSSKKFDFSGPRKFDEASNYKSKSMLVIPMKNHEGKVTGVLQLINAINYETKEITPFSEDVFQLVEAIASQAAIAIENTRLLAETKGLFESIIQVLAVAVDAKSHYTGNHVQRVAHLNLEIAKAISEDNTLFSNVIFNENQLEEIRLAGWLHDIGKVTTPVWVMDKGKKLETITDGTELVRERFLIFRKELEKKIIELSEKKPESNDSMEIYNAKIREIDDDLQIIMRSNNPEEFVDDERVEILKVIASKTFDVDGKKVPFLTENELENISIRKGSLNEKEMLEMRDHVVWTQKMLEKLHFPEHLKNVAIYAAQHHEKLNGKGYPYGLKGEEIPIQSRILAIADFYEALSASDRPYKKKMSYEKIISILKYAAQMEEIDAKIFNFLLDQDFFNLFEERYKSI